MRYLQMMWFGKDKIYMYNGSSWIEETGSIGDNIKIIQMLNLMRGLQLLAMELF